MSVNFSNAKLSDYFQLSGSSARSEGNFILENDGKGGFILGIDNHHRYIKGVNAQKGLTGSEDDKANNRKLNLGFYKEFSDFVNGSGYRDCVSVQRVLVMAREQLLQTHVENPQDKGLAENKGLDTPLKRRTVKGLEADLKSAIESESELRQEAFENTPKYKTSTDVFTAIDEIDDKYEKGILKLSDGTVDYTNWGFLASKTDTKYIRIRLSDALRQLAQDARRPYLQGKAMPQGLLERINEIEAKASALVAEDKLEKNLTVGEAKTLSREFKAAVTNLFPHSAGNQYVGGSSTKETEVKRLNDDLEPFNQEKASVSADRQPNPPSPEFANALKGILGKTSLTLNAAQVGESVIPPFLDYLKAFTGASIGGGAVRTGENGRLMLTLTDVKTSELISRLVDDKLFDAEGGGKPSKTASLAGSYLGNSNELTIALEPKIVMRQVEGGAPQPVLQLSLPQDGNNHEKFNLVTFLKGGLPIIRKKLQLPRGITLASSPDSVMIDVDLANLEKNPLAGLGLSPADLTSLNVGENGVKLGFCEPAANRPANPQPDAAEPRLDSPHSLEADLGVNDLLNNAKAIAKDQLTVAQGKVPRNSPEWREKENLKGVIDHLGALSLAADQTRGTLELRATDITLGDHLNLLPEDSKAKTAVKWLDPRNLSLKFKPKVEADGKVSLEVTDFTYTSGGLIGGLVAKALKYKAVRQLVWKYFGDRIAGALRGKLGPEASVSLQENGWPKVTLPAVRLTQGVLNGATDFAGRISEIKVTNRGIKIGADVDHAVRNRVVLRVNASEKRRMAEFETITAGENPVIGKKETDELKEIKAVLKKGKADLEKLLEEARKRAIVHPDWPKIGSLADMRVTLKRLEEDLAKIDARLKELHIVLQEEPNPA